MKRIFFSIILIGFALFCCANTLNEQLWQAIIAGNEPLAVELINRGADINSLDEQGGLSLMHRYASGGNDFMIQWLYEHGADVNVRDLYGSTPIFYTVKNGDYRRTHQLLSLGAEIDIVNQEGLSPRLLVAQAGSKLLQQLFDDPSSYSERITTTDLFLERQSALQQGDWNKAIELAKQEYAQAPKEWTKTSPYYTRGMTDLGTIYLQLGKHREAEECYSKAVKYWKKALPESEQYFFNLTALALLYRETGENQKALKLLNQCAEHIESFTNSQVKWQIYSNRAQVLTLLGEYERAEADYQLAIPYISQLVPIIQNQAWCITMGNYAMMYLYKSTPESLKKFEEMLQDVLRSMESHQLYDQTYLRFNQQFCLYETEYGVISVAEEHVGALIAVTKALLGEEHDDYLTALNLASEIAMKQDKYAQAYAYLTEAMEIIKRRKTHPASMEWSIVSNWANLVDLILDDESALWAHEFALRKVKELYGEKSVYYLQQIGNMGVFWSDRKQYERAIPFQLDAYNRSKELYGMINANTLVKGYNLWLSYAGIASKRDSAYYYLQENDTYIRAYIQNIFGVMSEQQRESFWRSYFSSHYSVVRPSFLKDYAAINPMAYGDMYDDLLFTRGLLLNSNDAFDRVLAHSTDSVLRTKWQQLLALKTRLSSSQAMDSKERKSVERQKDRLEREIAISSQAYRTEQENFSVRWQDVQRALKEDEVAIEFTINGINHWGHFENKTDSILYYALVLRKHDAHPQLIPLFEREELGQFYDGRNDLKMYEYDIHQDAAYKLIWKKITPYLKDCSTIYFAPTHALAQIALEALPVTEDSVFGDYYHMYRLTSTREIVKKHDSVEPTYAALYGGIRYDVSAEDMLAESERYADLALSSTRSIDPTDTIDRGRLRYLPGTKREVERIRQELTAAHCSTALLTDMAANEESFIAISGQPNNIIHLATHGFFWREDVAKEKEVFKQQETQETIDPLSRCGLLFAGANMALQGHSAELSADVQDGILTAREIATMDLSACDLAVLSACSTGVGEYSEDGTIGLQRAFKQAGVQSLIMTLWPVNDNAAQLMMTEFYRNWITLHQSKREAFRNAQNTVRAQYEEPVYWAGFIMLD